MTGPEHYTRAEQLTVRAEADIGNPDIDYQALLKAAQVHATLADAAAAAMSRYCSPDSFLAPDRTAWYHVAGVQDI